MSFINIQDENKNTGIVKNKKQKLDIKSWIQKLEKMDQNDGSKNNIISDEYGLFRAILMYYATTDVKVSSTAKLISLSSFISSIGGNLGLFVGFSFLSVLLFMYKILKRMCHQRQQKESSIDARVL